MISKRRHLEFIASSILRKEKKILRDLIDIIKKNREIYRRNNEYEHMGMCETIDGVELYVTVTYDYNQSSEEILFCFYIVSMQPYPDRHWDNCTVDSVLKHLQEYLNNVIIRKKIII